MVPVPIRWNAEWAPKLWGRDGQENLYPRDGNRTSLIRPFVRPTYSTVTMLTELHNGMAPAIAWVPTLFSSFPLLRKQPVQISKYNV